MGQALAEGITIAFGTSGFSGNITDIGQFYAAVRAAVDASHQGTVGAMPKKFSQQVDMGALQFNVQFDPGEDPPIDGAEETITVTCPDGELLSGTGAMTGYTPSGTKGELMMADVEVTWDGPVTINAGAGAVSGSGSGPGEEIG